MKNKFSRQSLSFYLAQEKKILLIITITGILYNLGMVAGPWFEGKLVQCLVDILQGQTEKSRMLTLALYYCITFFWFSSCVILSDFLFVNLPIIYRKA